jgi:hypothetical protein
MMNERSGIQEQGKMDTRNGVDTVQTYRIGHQTAIGFYCIDEGGTTALGGMDV